MRGKAILFIGAVIVAVLTGGIGCKSDSGNPYGASSSSPPPNTTPNTVSMRSDSFLPGSITVARGTTITWRNDDGITHTATSDSPGWDTGDVPPGASKTTTFNTPGTFNYHCTYHRTMGMVGTITVQ
jgi:plastocyanin